MNSGIQAQFIVKNLNKKVEDNILMKYFGREIELQQRTYR